MTSVSTTVPSSPPPAATEPAAATDATGSTSGSTAAPAAAQPPATGNGSTSGSQPDFRTSIPEAFREKNYLRDVKSQEDVFKMLDGAQTLLGKQGKLRPADDAAAEEWEKYYAANGRPESADKYEFKRPDGVQVNQEVDNAVKGIFHKYGVGTREAQGIVAEYEALAAGQEALIDKEFDTFADEYFGSKEAADKALQSSQVLLDKILPEKARKFLPMADSKFSMLLAAIATEVQSKYVGEDQTRLNNSGNAAASTQTKADIEAEGTRLMNTPEWKDPFHPGHAQRRAEVEALYAKINKLPG